MEHAFAGGGVPTFLVPRALAMHLADLRLPKSRHGRLQNFAEVEAAPMTQGTGAIEVKYGLGGLQICPIDNALSSGDNFAVKIKQLQLEGF